MVRYGGYVDLKTLDVKRGGIYMCNLGEGKDSVQGGIRPVLVIKNKKGIDYGTILTVVPITSKINKGVNLPTHIPIGVECGLSMESELQVEQATTISKNQLLFENNITKELRLRKLGEVSDIILKKIDIAYRRDNGFIDLYFNNKYAFKLLELASAIKNNRDLLPIKQHLVTEFKDYCDAYNKDYNDVIRCHNQEKRKIIQQNNTIQVYN